MRLLHVLGIALLVIMSAATPAEAAANIKKLKKRVGQLIQVDEIDEAIAAIQEIGAVGDDESREALYEIGRDFAVTEKIYKAVITEIVRHTGVVEYTLERYKKVKSKGDFQERVYIANLLSYLDSDEARKAVIGFLEDKSDFVKREAVRGLAQTMHRDAVFPLIQLVEDLSKKRRDVLYHEVRDALFALTGEDFELADDWISWWEPVAAHFDPKAERKDGTTGVRKRKRGENPEFFGVPVDSKNIVFVIDTSGSMRYVVKNDIPGLSKGDGSDGGGSSGGSQMTQENIRLAKFWMRMSMAQRELEKVVKQLEKDARFNMINFDNNVYVFSRKGAVVAASAKKKAVDWCETLKYREKGATNTEDALLKAFELDPKTNTIFFLSDGLPSKDGRVNDPTDPILDKVFKANRFRKIKIHTFGFCEIPYPHRKGMQPDTALQAANQFLSQLAEKTGGTFTAMKVDPRRTPDNPDGPQDDPKEGENRPVEVH